MQVNTSVTKTVSKNIFNVWTEGNMTQNKQLISDLLSINAGKYTGRKYKHKSGSRRVSKNIFNVWTEGNMTQNKQLISGSLLSINAGKYKGRKK